MRDPSRHARVAVLAGVLVLAGTLFLADTRSRDEGSAALDRCAAELDRAATSATRSVSAMVEYVRPTLLEAGPGLEGELYALVAEQAAGAGDGLAEARGRCARVGVPWIHQELRARREACLRRADAVRAYLDRVAADGRVVAVAQPEPVGGC